MSRIIRVYDPNRNPAEWNRALIGSEVAVFVEDAAAELPLNDVEGNATCEIFDDAKAAEAHCLNIIADDPRMRRLVYDRRGRGVDPIAVYEHPKLRTKEISGSFRRWLSTALMVAALALIWLDWRSDFERMWPSILAWKFVTTALVFITWEATLVTQRLLNRRRARQARNL